MTRPILLDTNVLIWALNDDRALTRRMRSVISSTTASVHLSVVSAWEIAIKYQNGKLAHSTYRWRKCFPEFWMVLARAAGAASARSRMLGLCRCITRPLLTGC